jgi:hypothetical protein
MRGLLMLKQSCANNSQHMRAENLEADGLVRDILVGAHHSVGFRLDFLMVRPDARHRWDCTCVVLQC